MNKLLPSQFSVALHRQTLSTWQSVDVMLLPPIGSSRPATHIFSVKLPPGWTVDDARVGVDSWSGKFIGEDFTLTFQGGPFAASELYKIAGGGPAEVDRKAVAKHVITEEEINGIPAVLIRPRDDTDGFTGAILSMPSMPYGKVLLSREGLSLNEQAIAFAIFRSINP